MAIADDFTVDYVAKTVTHTSGTTTYSVNALYSWLMDLFDESAQMDDEIPMSAQTSSEYTLINGWTIDNTSTQFLYGGSISMNDGDDIWANVYTLGSIVAGSSLYILQDGSLITPWWSTGHIDVLILVKTGGVEIDGANITVFAREFGTTYDYFEIDLTTGGRQPVPLATYVDLNNQSVEGDIEDYQDGTTATIAIAYGSYAADIDQDGSNENYEVQIDCDNQRLSYVYEVCKYWTRSDSTTSLDGVDGNIYKYADATYTPVKASPLGTYGGGKFFGVRGVYLINVNSADSENYQLIDSDGNTVNPPSFATVSVTGVVSGDFVGVYLASGTSIAKNQLTINPTLNIATGTGFVLGTNIPVDTPSNGRVIVFDDSLQQDHIYRYDSYTGGTFVFPTAVSGTTTGGTTNSLTDTAVDFTSLDVSVLDMVVDNTNDEYAFVMSIVSGTELTTSRKLTSWNAVDYSMHSLYKTYGTDNAYVPYIFTITNTTSESVDLTYSADRALIARVRQEGIVPFQTTGTMTTSGFSAVAQRTTDEIIT